MHVLIAFLGSLVTVLWLLHRLAEMGVSLGGLNPWLWSRRRRWKKLYEGNPIFRLENPLEIAGLLTVAIAKLDGDMSAEEKQKILELFKLDFRMSQKDAADLMVACVHLLKDGEELRGNLKKVVGGNQVSFTPEQADSLLSMLEQVASLAGGVNERQRSFISQVAGYLRTETVAGAWN